jgi:multimeric flavodoxin WrbA
MKVLGICCSPRKGGNTESLVKEALRGAALEGAETDYFSVSGKHIEPCDGCRSCNLTGICAIKDDMQELYQKMVSADALIFATPTYNYGMTAQTKLIIDRSRAMRKDTDYKLANKVGGIIAVGGSLGLINIVKDLYFHIITNYMLPGDFVVLYALNKGDYQTRPEGLKATLTLGRQMARLANQKFSYPADLMKRPHVYGTWDQ